MGHNEKVRGYHSNYLGIGVGDIDDQGIYLINHRLCITQWDSSSPSV